MDPAFASEYGSGTMSAWWLVPLVIAIVLEWYHKEFKR